MKIVATVQDMIQTTDDSFSNHRISRIFCTTRPLRDIIKWASTTLGKDVGINDIQFSEYTGESI